MKYSIKVNEVRAKEGSNIKGFATVVFGDSFKITNIAILENKDKGELFVSMPRYRSNERDESNGVIYKDVCNPITAEVLALYSSFHSSESRGGILNSLGLSFIATCTVLPYLESGQGCSQVQPYFLLARGHLNFTRYFEGSEPS